MSNPLPNFVILTDTSSSDAVEKSSSVKSAMNLMQSNDVSHATLLSVSKDPKDD